jgi:hypothetical protein
VFRPAAAPPPRPPEWTGSDHRGAYRVDGDGGTREGWGGYRAVPDLSTWSNRETLVAPDGTEVCSLGEPEDRIFLRDLSPLVARLASTEAALAARDATIRQMHEDSLAAVRETAAERDRAQARLADARALCNGSCDIALARRQVGPDGVVPGNARECAEMWEREAHRLEMERRRLEEESRELRARLAAAGRTPP